MTVQLRSEPVRVTSWLAGWLDYVFALLLVAGRRIFAPLVRGAREPAIGREFAAEVVIGEAPAWAERAKGADSTMSGTLVKAAEIVMLSLAFFVAAHLLSGGTPTVTAPDLNPLGLIPDRARAEALPVPAGSGKQIEVQAQTFIYNVPRETPVEAEAETVSAVTAVTTEEAALAPASEPETAAAAATVAAPAPKPVEQPAAAAPAPAPVTPLAPTVTPVQPPVSEGRHLTAAELRTAALAAGWPAETLPQLESVAWCESRFHTHAEYFGAKGLMQVIPLWFAVAGVDANLWWDPVVNLKAAKAAYDEGVRNGYAPWSAWSCSPS